MGLDELLKYFQIAGIIAFIVFVYAYTVTNLFNAKKISQKEDQILAAITRQSTELNSIKENNSNVVADSTRTNNIAKKPIIILRPETPETRVVPDVPVKEKKIYNMSKKPIHLGNGKSKNTNGRAKKEAQ